MGSMSAAAKAGVLRPGDEVRFADRDDLLEKLDRLDLEVPKRIARRRRNDREHFVMRGYLRFLAGAGLLPVPVTLKKSAQDPPDFVLEWSDGCRETFEITEGTTKEYQQRLTVAARAGETGLILPIDIHTPAEDAAELWTRIQLSSFLQKAEALVRGRYSVDHLLIYDNTGVGLFAPLEECAPLLRAEMEEWIRKEQPAHRYTRVSILRGFALLLDMTGEARLLTSESPYFRLSAIRAVDEDDLPRRLREIDRYCRENGIRHLKLFGSVLKDLAEADEGGEAGNGFGPDSDVDLLVEFEPGTTVTLLDVVRMERELSELIGFPVDLRTAGDLSRYFRQQVLRDAVELHAERA